VMLQSVIRCYFERDFLAAEAFACRLIQANPEYPSTYLWLVATLGQLDRLDEARVALGAAIEASPRYFRYMTGGRPPYYRVGDYQLFLDGLRKAGLQD
jgi:hypothetical protein